MWPLAEAASHDYVMQVLTQPGFNMRFLGSHSCEVWEWVGLTNVLNGVIENLLTYSVCSARRASLMVTKRLPQFQVSHLHTVPSGRIGWLPECLSKSKEPFVPLGLCEDKCPPSLHSSKQAAGSFLKHLSGHGNSVY